MEACVCPVCAGTGIYAPGTHSHIPTRATDPCHGCDARGWVCSTQAARAGDWATTKITMRCQNCGGSIGQGCICGNGHVTLTGIQTIGGL